jgi:Restriction endonuclease
MGVGISGQDGQDGQGNGLVVDDPGPQLGVVNDDLAPCGFERLVVAGTALIIGVAAGLQAGELRGRVDHAADSTCSTRAPLWNMVPARTKEVWRWMDWPARSGGDIRVDLVARDPQRRLIAIECTCYAPTATLAKEEFDSFVALSGQKQWSRRIIVATTDLWSTNADKSLEGHAIRCRRGEFNPRYTRSVVEQVLGGIAPRLSTTLCSVPLGVAMPARPLRRQRGRQVTTDR